MSSQGSLKVEREQGVSQREMQLGRRVESCCAAGFGGGGGVTASGVDTARSWEGHGSGFSRRSPDGVGPADTTTLAQQEPY